MVYLLTLVLWPWFCNFYMAAVVGIVSRCGLRIEVHCSNKPNKTKVVLYKLLLSLQTHLKQLYLSNKTEYINYEGEWAYVY